MQKKMALILRSSEVKLAAILNCDISSSLYNLNATCYMGKTFGAKKDGANFFVI